MPPPHPAPPLRPHPSVSYPIHPSLPFALALFSFPPLRSPLVRLAPLHYFIRFFFFGLSHRQTFEPPHGHSTRSYGVRAEGTRTVELVAPYVPCRRRRYSLSYPYRTSSLRALRADIELRDREPEPGRVWIFGSLQRGTTRGSTDIRLPSFDAPYADDLIRSGAFGNVPRLDGPETISF